MGVAIVTPIHHTCMNTRERARARMHARTHIRTHTHVCSLSHTHIPDGDDEKNKNDEELECYKHFGASQPAIGNAGSVEPAAHTHTRTRTHRQTHRHTETHTVVQYRCIHVRAH